MNVVHMYGETIGPEAFLCAYFFMDFIGLLPRMKINDAELNSVPIFSQYIVPFPYWPSDIRLWMIYIYMYIYVCVCVCESYVGMDGREI